MDGEQLRRLPDPEINYVAEIIEPVFPLSSARPSAQAVRQAQIVVISDRGDLERDFGPDTAAAFDAAGLKTAVCVPIPGTRRTLGTLILGWETPYQIDVSERAILATAPVDQPLPDLLQRLVAEVAGPSSRDDIALLAVRVCAG